MFLNQFIKHPKMVKQKTRLGETNGIFINIKVPLQWNQNTQTSQLGFPVSLICLKAAKIVCGLEVCFCWDSFPGWWFFSSWHGWKNSETMDICKIKVLWNSPRRRCYMWLPGCSPLHLRTTRVMLHDVGKKPVQVTRKPYSKPIPVANEILFTKHTLCLKLPKRKINTIQCVWLNTTRLYTIDYIILQTPRFLGYLKMMYIDVPPPLAGPQRSNDFAWHKNGPMWKIPEVGELFSDLFQRINVFKRMIVFTFHE